MSIDSNTDQESRILSERLLHIDNPAPVAIYATILKQTSNRDMYSVLAGEQIGYVDLIDPDHPLKSIETRVNAIRTFASWEDIPEEPGHKIGVGEKIKEFGMETRFNIGKGVYISNSSLGKIIENLQREGYNAEIPADLTGFRKIKITGAKGVFELNLGFSDKETELKFRHNDLEKYKNTDQNMACYFRGLINKIEQGDNLYEIVFSIENAHPGRAPSTRKIESKEQVMRYLEDAKDLTEIIATSLTKSLGLGRNFESVAMTWKSKSVPSALWHEPGRVQKKEDLQNLSVEEINSSMVRVIQAINTGKDIPDLIDENGMDSSAKKLLQNIEVYFTGRNITEKELKTLNNRDKSLLALGLVLKAVDQSKTYGDEIYYPPDESEIAGIIFHVYGESMRNRFEFFMQQDRKFGYGRDNAEAADFLLLHTTYKGQKDTLTRYEIIQSENLEKARKWIIEELEPTKKGNYETADVIKINNLLLDKLVPDSAKNELRHTKNAYLQGRIGMTDPDSIEFNLGKLLKTVGNYVTEEIESGPQKDIDTLINRLSREWACFDAIHPMEEGNGRTGTLLFESWYRLIMGTEKRFISPRNETQVLSEAMRMALKGNSDRNFWYPNQTEYIDEENLSSLRDYIKSHIV